MEIAVIGCGYVGMRLAARLAARGHRVHGIRRRIPDPAPFEAVGIVPLELDLTRPETLDRLPDTLEGMVNAVSSSRGGVEEYRRVYLEGTRTLVERFTGIRRYLHVGSTGVYGQTGGEWVEEDAERRPATETARVLVETEDLLLGAWRTSSFPAILARVSGIYGPGRGHLFRRYVEGSATMHGDGGRHLNMIHVEDLVRLLDALLETGVPGEVYNLTDDAPVRQRDFLLWLSRQLGRPLPPPVPGEPQGKRAPTDKRVSNRRLHALLDYRFAYPTWKEGYAPLVEEVRRRNRPPSDLTDPPRSPSIVPPV